MKGLRRNEDAIKRLAGIKIVLKNIMGRAIVMLLNFTCVALLYGITFGDSKQPANI